MAKKAKGGSAVSKPFTKSETLAALTEATGLARKQVAAVLDELGVVINRHLKKGGAGTFTVPGLMKIKTIRKPAQKARKNVPNPFKPGEMMDVAAKPARTVVKVLPLKKLKDMAS